MAAKNEVFRMLELYTRYVPAAQFPLWIYCPSAFVILNFTYYCFCFSIWGFEENIYPTITQIVNKRTVDLVVWFTVGERLFGGCRAAEKGLQLPIWG